MEKEALGDMEEKEARTEETQKIFAPLIFLARKKAEKETEGNMEKTAKMEEREKSVLKVLKTKINKPKRTHKQKKHLQQ